MSNRLTNIIAAVLLAAMFFIAVFSMKDDSLTMDELSHLPAGYSYLTQKDMRINPEHPPLIKDLAAIPLLFMGGINFPSEIKEWKEDVNGQWGFGSNFLYHSGNPVDKMIFWGRIPMVLVLILLGFYIFKIAKELFGREAALLSLFLFSFSPTFLAHGRLVTTDVGAAAGCLIASFYFLKTLKEPSKKNIILAGISFGLAELCKFSVILLVPFFIFLGFSWWLINSKIFEKETRISPFTGETLYGIKLKKVLKTLLLVFILGLVLIWPVYQYHVWNYPPERQLRDTETLLASQANGQSSIKEACFSLKRLNRCPAEVIIWTADKPILRPFSQYGLGILLVLQRAAYGHTMYFWGEVSAAGWKKYFPTVYLLKEPLSFHILTLIALFYGLFLLKNKKPFFKNGFCRLKLWLRSHFFEFALLSFIGLYWATSLKSNLNIGVRHLLPAFPFTFLLVSSIIIKWIEEIKKIPFKKVSTSFVSVLLAWYIASSLNCFPHFLAYSNELIGGPAQTYIYTVDSNLDWGQDLKRLTKWADEKKVDKIYIDYFGGGDAGHYLKEKYEPWWGTRNPEELPKNNYLAVSVSSLQGGRGKPAPGFDQPTGYYKWLDNYTPVAKIGYSIFVYYIE